MNTSWFLNHEKEPGLTGEMVDSGTQTKFRRILENVVGEKN